MTSLIRVAITCLILHFLIAASSALAGKEPFVWDEVSDSDWTVVADSARGIVNGAIIFEKMKFDDREYYDKDRCYRTLYRRVRVLSDEGRSLGDVNVPIVHFEQKIEEIQGRTILPDGTISELQEESIFKKEAVRVKREALEQYSFSLPGVTSDCIIEYMIRYKTPKPVNNWTVQHEIPLLHGECDWLLGQLTIRGSLMRRIYEILGMPGANYVWIRAPEDRAVELIPNRQAAEEIIFKIGFVPPFEGEPFTFPEASLTTRLICYYGSLDESDEFWLDLAMDLEDFVDGYCKKDRKLEDIVDEFPELDSDSARVAYAFNWVRDNIVNADYEPCVWRGGRERDLEENKNINDILDQNCGDSRDIDLLFTHLLNMLDIDARLAFVRDRVHDMFVPPAKYWQFDEVLVAIPQGRTYRLCSPGHYYTPIDMVPWYCEDVDALLVGASGFFRTPATYYDRNSRSAELQFIIDEDLEISGRAQLVLTGQYALEIRSLQGKPDSTACGDLTSEYLLEAYPTGELDSVECQGFTDCSAPLAATFQLTFPPLESLGDRVLLRPLAYMFDQSNPFTADERKYAVVFPYAHRSAEQASFVLPPEWQISTPPRDTSFSNDFGRCAVRYEMKGDTLYVERETALFEHFVRAVYYQRFKSLFVAQEEMAAAVVVLERRPESTDD